MAKKKKQVIKIDDSDDIPAFLRVTEADIPRRRKAAEAYFASHKIEPAEVVKFDPRKPASMTSEEWERVKAEAKALAEKKQRKKVLKPAPVDLKGKVWDLRKSRWVEDTRPSLREHAPAQPLPPKRKGKTVVKASTFGIREGTNREKLAIAMAARLGEMVPLTEWSVAVYGKENANACVNVIGGVILDLKKNKVKFEIIKDKINGQIVYGLFEIGAK